MCGRFTQSLSGAVIAQAFGLSTVPNWAPRYNIAPTQTIPAILANEGSAAHRQFKELRWGLVPAWAKDSAIGTKLINARSETVAEKPSFRSAFKQRRCLITADGFFEWKKEQGKKQPFYFRLATGEPFAFAGLWERWQAPTGEVLETCTILTTTANELLAEIHDRMPVMLDAADYDRWLDVKLPPLEAHSLLRPYAAKAMQSYPVSRQMNSPFHDDADCIRPLLETV